MISSAWGFAPSLPSSPLRNSQAPTSCSEAGGIGSILKRARRCEEAREGGDEGSALMSGPQCGDFFHGVGGRCDATRPGSAQGAPTRAAAARVLGHAWSRPPGAALPPKTPASPPAWDGKGRAQERAAGGGKREKRARGGGGRLLLLLLRAPGPSKQLSWRKEAGSRGCGGKRVVLKKMSPPPVPPPGGLKRQRPVTKRPALR